MEKKCDDCGRSLNLNEPDNPSTDWIKVVCSECGNVMDISIVRLKGKKVEGK